MAETVPSFLEAEITWREISSEQNQESESWAELKELALPSSPNYFFKTQKMKEFLFPERDIFSLKLKRTERAIK